jgi:hypothetical protein
VWVTHVVDLGACAECISLSVALERVASAAAHSQVGASSSAACTFSQYPSAPLPECHPIAHQVSMYTGCRAEYTCCDERQGSNEIATHDYHRFGVSSLAHGHHGWGMRQMHLPPKPEVDTRRVGEEGTKTSERPCHATSGNRRLWPPRSSSCASTTTRGVEGCTSRVCVLHRAGAHPVLRGCYLELAPGFGGINRNPCWDTVRV